MPAVITGLSRWPALRTHTHASAWLQLQTDLGLAPRTIDAYGRALDEYVASCSAAGIDATRAGRADVARYVRQLATRAHRHGADVVAVDSGVGLSNATMQQRLVEVPADM